ncbi:MAG: hypothetical protein IJ571_03210 [Ruminococcus sp.]|nr:hypothetical protein [Clostridia bacterium]MBR1422441.1 hypothetical protein [Ruminococcus sp.]
MYRLNNFLGERFERIQTIIDSEYGNINSYINLIGSANYAFPSVLKALDTPFNLNPLEGSRGKRYFPMSRNIDELNNLGEELLNELFKTQNYYANFEPYSGTQANHIVYQAILSNDDKVLAMSPRSGGHVSHSLYLKQHYNLLEYDITSNEEIDYDVIYKICLLERPKLLIAGYSSYPRAVDYAILGNICKKTGTLLLADISHTAIYIMADTHISPFEHADFVTFTTHKTTRGIRGGIVMCKKKFTNDINRAIFPIEQGAPKFNEVLAKLIMLYELKEIDINEYVNTIMKISQKFVEIFVSYGIKIYTSGTDTHLILIDLRNEEITGQQCESLLCQEHILVNRNQLPNDKRNAFDASGIRLGVLTLATINMSCNDYSSVAEIIAQTVVKKQIVDNSTAIEIMKRYNIVN